MDLVAPWGTCGGEGFYGSTNCTTGYLCAKVGKWYSQCIPAVLDVNLDCTSAGLANTDISGIGVLVALGIQAFISLGLSTWSEYIYVPGTSYPNEILAPIHTRRSKTMLIISHILLATCEAQTITGIAMLISAFSYEPAIDLYHLHLVYDIVSFAGISNLLAIFHDSINRDRHFKPRLLITIIFACLFFSFTVFFGVKLRSWDANLPGHCYNGRLLSAKSLQQPAPAYCYLSITAVLFFSCLIATIAQRIHRRSQPLYNESRKWHRVLLVPIILQFPLHAYSIMSLRVIDQHFLITEQSEDEWGFGQVIVMVSLQIILFECYKIIKYARSLGHDTSAIEMVDF